MRRVLIVKTTSMGDVIHALPVVTDIKRAFPALEIDWMVEQPFADLVALHSGVSNVLFVALRTWRQTGILEVCRQWWALKKKLKPKPYDLIIDLQGLIKSACLAKAACGELVGPGWQVAREPLATLFYQRHAIWDNQAHAVARLRQLSASLLGYSYLEKPDFGLQPMSYNRALQEHTDAQQAWFLHATARAEKAWPVQYWRKLAQALVAQGWQVNLPWGSDAELKQAQAIALNINSVCILPRMNLACLAQKLRQAQLVVGVDTGLMHLSAALYLPMVALFFATEQWRFAPIYNPRAISLGQLGVVPGVDDVLFAVKTVVNKASAMQGHE